jgi:tetratricopeptide (TPR) repeat protein
MQQQQQDDGGKPSSARAVKRHNKRTNRLAREEAEEVARKDKAKAKRRLIRSVAVKECAATGCGRVKGAAADDPKMRACGRCKAVHYCSVACQHTHWAEAHREVCVAQPPKRSLTRLQKDAIKYNARLEADPTDEDAARMALLCRVDAHVCRTEYKEAMEDIESFLLQPNLRLSTRIIVMYTHCDLCKSMHTPEAIVPILKEMNKLASEADNDIAIAEIVYLQAGELMKRQQHAAAANLLERAIRRMPANFPHLSHCLEAMHDAYLCMGEVDKAQEAGAAAIAAAPNNVSWNGAECMHMRMQLTEMDGEAVERALDTADVAEATAKSSGDVACRRKSLVFQRRLLRWRRTQHTLDECMADRWDQVEMRIAALARTHGTPAEEADALELRSAIAKDQRRYADAAAHMQAAINLIGTTNTARLTNALTRQITLHLLTNMDEKDTKAARDAAMLLLPEDDIAVAVDRITTMARVLLDSGFTDAATAELEVAAAHGDANAIDLLHATSASAAAVVVFN